jgi:hypothetical protein
MVRMPQWPLGTTHESIARVLTSCCKRHGLRRWLRCTTMARQEDTDLQRLLPAINWLRMHLPQLVSNIAAAACRWLEQDRRDVRHVLMLRHDIGLVLIGTILMVHRLDQGWIVCMSTYTIKHSCEKPIPPFEFLMLSAIKGLQSLCQLRSS